jgi:hypothetical protein
MKITKSKEAAQVILDALDHGGLCIDEGMEALYLAYTRLLFATASVYEAQTGTPGAEIVSKRLADFHKNGVEEYRLRMNITRVDKAGV